MFLKRVGGKVLFMNFTDISNLVGKINGFLNEKGFCSKFQYKRKELANLGKAGTLTTLLGNIKEDWAINEGGNTEVQYHINLGDDKINYGIGFNAQYTPFKNEMASVEYIKPFVNAFLEIKNELLITFPDYKLSGSEDDLKNIQDGDYFLWGKSINIVKTQNECKIKDEDFEMLLQDLEKQFDAYIKIYEKRNEIIEMQNSKNSNMQNIHSILEAKKQIILQGAPGTGKTYATAEIALRMIGKTIPTTREDLMKAYQEAVKSGQIVFTTFHQSMDYEEFIEGLKPNVNDKGELFYEVQNGIFKDICEKASLKNANSFDEAYQKMLQDISEQDDEMLILKTVSNKEFGIKVNSNQNLTLYTGSREKSMGSLTKSNIILSLSGNVSFSGWEGYFQSVVKALKEKYGFVDAESNENKKHVLIIDEINRGNISKIFGELITLLEADKRIGATNEIKVRLPYSKAEFGVPSNVYIIGTMNTTDRSLGFIDYAVRRRFAFHTLKADKSKIENDKVKTLFESIEQLIEKNLNTIDFNIDDIMIGHSYFLAKNDEDLKLKLDYEIKPLLREYVKDGILNLDDDVLVTINNLTI